METSAEAETVENLNASLSALIMVSIKRKAAKKRKLWSRKWLLRRKALGCYENLMKELALEDVEGYRRWIRMDTDSFQHLLGLVEPLINKKQTNMRDSISAGERLAITLRYLATGETQTSLAYQFRVAQNTISGIIPLVCRAIHTVLKDKYLRFPRTPEEWKMVAIKFYHLWNFPMCLGALDGKHVAISHPPHSGSSYYNYKKFFSIVLMALVDADLKFLYVDIGTNGRISDGGVWDKCSLKHHIESGKSGIPNMECLPGTHVTVPYVIVADDAFPLELYMMKPYPGSSNEEKRIFNYRLSRARRVSENAFGILAARFQVFKGPILTLPQNVVKIVLATCCLHNYLRTKCLELYTPPSSLDSEDVVGGVVNIGTWRSAPTSLMDLQRIPQRGGVMPRQVRDKLTTYLNGQGAVPWQKEMCNLH